MTVPALRLLTESDPARRTYYERNGYGRRGPALTTQCRVASVPANSWHCRRHNRHIMVCLNERIETERTVTLPAELVRLHAAMGQDPVCPRCGARREA